MKTYLNELLHFAWMQVLCCVFPAAVFGLLAVSHFVPVYMLFRYDFLLIGCLAVQALMLHYKLETRDELWVICLFHLLGLAMEVFKVHKGSWYYPEYALSKVGDVPLYSGFMYASVASYFCQAWRRFRLHIVQSPSTWLSLSIAGLVYLNFFTHHYLPDLRLPLAIGIGLVYFRTKVAFTVTHTTRHMPLLLSFMLIGFFIYIGENIATWLGAWQYAYQHAGWQVVHFQKAGSWTLMAIVSYILVSELKFYKLRLSVTPSNKAS